jgi:radical SAM peptide maturase (CXXX-repeat target family)
MIRYDNFEQSPYNDWLEIDIIVSRDCTLRCTYCYLHKNKESSYDIDNIIKSLDKLLSECDTEGVVLSFYPEPWVDVERSNELIKRSVRSLLKYPKFSTNYMIMLGTNGVKLDEKIPMIEHLNHHLSLNVTIDGTKEPHDMYRLFSDGRGSWEIVKNNIKKYKEKYRINGTKVTLGPDTLKFIYDSTLFLWDEMNFSDINMNVVFEDLWKSKLEKSLEIFEEQLSKLTDEIIRNKRWKTNFNGLLATRNIPFLQLSKLDKLSNKTYCGATKMRSIDVDGSVYPCFRLSPYSMKEDKSFSLDIKNERLRSLSLLDNFDTSPKKCRECPLLSSCAMCVGGAYEEKHSLFWRTTYHCEFQKLQYKYSRKLYNIMNPDEQIEDFLEK